MRILVVEDTQKNIDSARAMLSEHQLTIATGYDEALSLLTPKLDEHLAAKLLNERLPEGWRCSEFTEGCPVIVDPEGNELCFFYDDLQGLWNQTEKDASFVPFDIILTDVMIPKGGNKCMNGDGAALAQKQGPMPYGPVIALRAIQVGIKKVGVLTSGNHHSDPFVFAFDGLEGFAAGDVKVVCSNKMDTNLNGICAKNWAEMLSKLV